MKFIFIVLFFLPTLSNLAAQESIEPYSGWLETETEHFNIIYEEKSTSSVIEIKSFCEDVYKSVTSFFDSYPEKIILVVHDRIDAANGSFYPAPPHINLYVSVPSTPDFGAKIDNWLRFLLTHELTHYVNMTIKKGLFYRLSRVMGKSATTIPGGLMPGWAIEGIAVKLESDITGGGRGNNPFFEMFSKALILDKKLFSWRQAAYSSYHPPSSRIYVGGYIINNYMAQTYGNDIFVRIYKEFLNFPLLGFNHYVKKITGDSTKTIFTNMELALKQKYSTINSTRGKLISPDTESDYYLPVITTSGWIVYRETADRAPALVSIDPVSKKETVLVETRLTDYESFSASENGNIIVFAALNIDYKHPTGIEAVSDLYLFDKTRNKTRKLTCNSHISQPAISPDGQNLAAIQKSGQYTRLAQIDIKTGQIKALFEKENASIFNPAFSKDGKQIVFTVQDERGRSIWLKNKDTSPRELTFSFPGDLPGDAYNPLFRANGNLVFVSDTGGTPELYELEMAGSEMAKKIYTDSVGIFSGFVYNNKIIYSTYSYLGYTLRTALYPGNLPIVSYNTNQTVHVNIKSQNLLEAETDSNAYTIIQMEHKKYKDTPELIVFSPIPFYIDPIYTSSRIFGPGMTAYFRSILGKSEIFTTFTLNTTMMQPGGSLEFNYNWGPVKLEYSLLQGYSETSNNYKALQTSRQQLVVTIPILSQSNLGTSTYLGFFTGITDDFSINSNKDFPFFSPEPGTYTEYKNSAFQVAGMAYSLTGIKSRRDTIPPLQISSSTSVFTPFTRNYFKKYAINSTNSINLPSPIDHQVFRFSGRFTYSGMVDLRYLNSPRGFSISTSRDISLLSSADYLFKLAVPDWPIMGGLSLQGITGSVHLEKLFSMKDKKVVADKNYYAGLEFILLGNYINIFESAGFGVSYRFQPDTDEFSPANLGIYLFIGTNSFR